MIGPRDAAAASGRRRRILLSYGTAGVSKGVAAAVQLLALPIVAMALGTQRFGALLVLGAVGALFCMPARAIVPAAAFGIARARGRGDAARAGAELRSAAFLSAALGAAGLAVAGAGAMFLDPSVLFGRGAGPVAAEAAGGAGALLLLIFATYFLAWVEGVRTGYEENHLNNLFTLLGSAAALGGIALAWAFAPTIPAFFVALFVSYPLLQGLNLLLLPRERWRGAGGSAARGEVLRGTARRALSWGVAQGGIVLHLQGSVYLAAQAFGLGAGALVGGMVRLFQILHNLLLAFLTPVLPTLSHAAAAGDAGWLSRTGRRAALVVLAGTAFPAAVIALFGDRIVAAWLGIATAPDPLLYGAFAAMAVFHIAAQLYYLVLLALGDGRGPSRTLLRAGIAGLIAGFAAMQAFGLAGLIWGQAAAMALVGFAPIALRLARRLRAGSSDAEAVVRPVED